MNIFAKTFRCASRQTYTQVTPNLFRNSRSAFKRPCFDQAQLFTTPPKPRKYINMAHSTPDELAVSLQNLGLEQTLESYPNCYPELNPTDVYRAHITSILADITGADKSIIYPNLQWTMTLDKGDLILPVAALRIKGRKPQDLAVEWAEKVRRAGALSHMTRLTIAVPRDRSSAKAKARRTFPRFLLQGRQARSDPRPNYPQARQGLRLQPKPWIEGR